MIFHCVAPIIIYNIFHAMISIYLSIHMICNLGHAAFATHGLLQLSIGKIDYETLAANFIVVGMHQLICFPGTILPNLANSYQFKYT